jgi:hypothetical protein
MHVVAPVKDLPEVICHRPANDVEILDVHKKYRFERDKRRRPLDNRRDHQREKPGRILGQSNPSHCSIARERLGRYC